MIDLDVADPHQRALLKATLLQDGKEPPRPNAGEAIFVKMPDGFLEGDAAYLIASFRYLLFQALDELDRRKVGMQ